jgi:aminopeptidase N
MERPDFDSTTAGSFADRLFLGVFRIEKCPEMPPNGSMTFSLHRATRCLLLSCVSMLAAAVIGAVSSTEADRQTYAPSRQIDILHLTLDVTPNFPERTLTGSAMLRFKPIAHPLEELRLDGVDLRVSSVNVTESILGWQATDKQVVVTFSPAVPVGRETTVTIHYSATPKKGMYFRTPELGYPAGDMHLFTQGEAIESRYWFPGFDAPNEKSTSEVICHVPEGMVVLSNGRLISETKDPGSNLVAVRWLQDKPHSTYLIALAAGYFKKVEDRHGDIPLAFYVPASQIELAARSFADTGDMMAFFERETGIPYPWAKYDQVCVEDHVAGGMENTTLTILTSSTLFPDGFEGVRDSHGLVAHELAHQWFGDYVTCKDWANLWLNEGFATYYEELYQGHRLGRDELLYRLHQSAQGIIAHENETNAIVRRTFHDPDEQFSYLAYPKGGWVLHMLRSQLGDELYRRCIQVYLERHAFGTVVTEDLNQVIEELSGRSFDRFFDQWVFHASQPELSVQYSWDQRTKLAKISLAQSQKLSEQVMLFDFPLPVRFTTANGTFDRVIPVRQQSEDFYFPLPEAPKVARIDPEVTVLARIQFSPPRAMLEAQLTNRDDLVGRLLAVEKLKGQRDALTLLKKVLAEDPFYGVRLAASQAIRAIPGPESFQVLRASTNQPDARVRRQVINDLAGFYHEDTFAALIGLATRESNPDLRAAAITSLGAYAKPEVQSRLLACLETPSFHNILADAAISAMRGQDDAVYVSPLLHSLKDKPAGFTMTGLGRAFEALAWLARQETNRDPVREFLLGYLTHPHERVRMSAIRALGILGDPKAIAPLETMLPTLDQGRTLSAAQKSVNDLRDQRKPSLELNSLRTELLDLKRENRELNKSVDDLKKQLEALTGRLYATPSPTNRATRPPSKTHRGN